MKAKLLMSLGLLGLLAGGCATTPVPDYDEFFRQLNPPYFEGTQINVPARPVMPANELAAAREWVSLKPLRTIRFKDGRRLLQWRHAA